MLLWSLRCSSRAGLRPTSAASCQPQLLLQLFHTDILTTSEHIALGITITPQFMELDLGRGGGGGEEGGRRGEKRESRVKEMRGKKGGRGKMFEYMQHPEERWHRE